MTDKEPVRIRKATIEDDGESLSARLEIHNDSGSTVHFIAAVRQLLYDPASRQLTVRLSDHGLAELPFQPPFEVQPPMAAVDAHGRREITVKLPRHLTRVEPGPSIVQLPAHEATTVNIEVGWSDRAFYRDPRGKGGGMRAQLKKWERRVAAYQCRGIAKKGPPSQPPSTPPAAAPAAR